MLSSTSNSDQRKPEAMNWVSWLFMVLTVAVLVVLAESSWRAEGYQPHVVDGADVWAIQRDVVEKEPGSFVVIGSSRMHAAFSSEVFRSRPADH